MQNVKQLFAAKLRAAMEAAGYAPKPAVLERGFNTRYWGKPMTLHGVRRWLQGETLPSYPKLQTLSIWLRVPIEELVAGAKAPSPAASAARIGNGWTEVGYDDRQVVDLYLALPIKERRLARDVILTIARAHELGVKRK